MKDLITIGATAVGAGMCAGAAYARWLKPVHDRWGTSAEEAEMVLPGDGRIREPATQVTRGITVNAPPEAVWPWLVQMGADRGGFYSYDWLEDLFGLEIHSADAIVPEWQRLEVGDVVYAARNRAGGWYVVEKDEPEIIALQLADLAARRPARRIDPGGWEFLWTFSLRDLGDGRTRLLVRERVGFGNSRLRWLMAPLGTVSFVMTRRMLLGIKERAEASVGAVALPSLQGSRALPTVNH